MNAATRALWNPIVAKEYRSRMRTWRSPLAITIYIVLLGGIGWAVFAALSAPLANGVNQGQTGSLGSQLFTFLVLFQVALLAFITPAITAGAISSERERQTIDLLFVTPIPPFSIIWGKLLASMSFIVVLLVISVPIFSLVFLFGGIELDQLAEAFLVTAVTAMMLGFVGVAFSTLFRHTIAATVAAYGAAFVLLVGTLIYGLLFPVPVNPSANTLPAPPAITFIGPAIPLITIATNAPVQGYGIRFPNSNGGPFLSSSTTQCSTSFSGGTVCQQFSSPAQQAPSTVIPTGLFAGWQYWEASIVMQLMVSAGALIVSAWLLPPVRRWRLLRRPSV
ncbi:MAG TPA: ABC transporter permease [Candidatus Dormibacteraeota bacterium]|nr:ABC transporter permease [Candidatus Dormibacteraeota bacterium]